MSPLLSPNDVLPSHGVMLGPFVFQPLHGFTQKRWMSYKLLLVVTSCLTPDEPADDPCAVPAPVGTSAALWALSHTSLCLDTPKLLFLSLPSASAVVSLVC